MGGFKWFLGRMLIPVAALGRDRRPMTRMADTLSVVERVLLVLPLDADARLAVLPHLFAFKAEFPSWQFDLLVLGGEAPTAGDAFKGIGVVRGMRGDMGALGLPSRDLVSRLKERAYGLVIDLSLDGHPFTPYLLGRAGIPLRMGINSTGRLRNRIYNMVVRLEGNDALLKRLAQTLVPICRTPDA